MLDPNIFLSFENMYMNHLLLSLSDRSPKSQRTQGLARKWTLNKTISLFSWIEKESATQEILEFEDFVVHVAAGVSRGETYVIQSYIVVRMQMP